MKYCFRLCRYLFTLLSVVPILLSAQSITLVVKSPLPMVSTARELISADIFNNSGNAADLYLELTLARGNTPLLKERTTPFKAQNGYSYISGLNTSLASFNTYSSLISADGAAILLPAGEYTLCMQVYSSVTNLLLADGCIEFTSSQLSPPFLISPVNEAVIHTTNPVLTWSAPSPLSPGIQISYRLVLAKLNPGQSAAEAITRNYPTFELTGIRLNSLIYPLSATRLEPDSRYAWKVYAMVANTEVAQTEIWTFIPENLTPSDIKGDDSYAILKKQSDDGYHLCHNGMLRFRFTEDYVPGKLTLHVYDSETRDVLAGCQATPTKKQGNNFYELDLNGCSFKPGQLYFLEALNEKNEVYKLTIKVRYDE